MAKYRNLREKRKSRANSIKQFSPSAKLSEWLADVNNNFELMVYGLYDLDGNSNASPYGYTNNVAHQMVMDEETGKIYRCKWFVQRKNWKTPPFVNGHWVKFKKEPSKH